MKRQIEKQTAEGKTKKKKRYREGWSIDRRNVHSVEEKYNLNVKTIKDETKKKKIREFRIPFQFRHFSPIGKMEAMRAYSSEYAGRNSRNKPPSAPLSTIPKQKCNNRTPPPPPRPMTNFERAGLPVLFFPLFFATIRIALYDFASRNVKKPASEKKICNCVKRYYITFN